MAGKPKEFAQGERGEDSVMELLSKIDISSGRPDKNSKFFDIIIKLDKEYTGEIKTDIMGKRTGNLAFEFWNSRKNEPSGISVSQADLWFHIFKDIIYVANTLELKLYIQNNPPMRTFFDAGDKNANIYLYKADTILDGVFLKMDSSLDKKKLNKQFMEKLPK
jgi:hypothetical protein